MTQLVRAEMMKITRQGTIRVVTLMLFGIAALYVLGTTINITGSAPLPLRAASYNDQLFPNGLLSGIQFIGNFSLLLVAVVVASVIGSEYGLDTWKNLLIRRNGRARFLAAKLVSAGFAMLVIFIISVLLVQGLSLIGHALVADSAAKAGIQQVAFNSDSFYKELLTSSFDLVMLMGVGASLATLFTIVGRSTVAGIMIAIVWQIADGMAGRVLPNWLGDFTFNSNLTSVERNLTAAGSGSIPIAQSIAVLAFYLLVPVVAAVIIFRKRDMAGN